MITTESSKRRGCNTCKTFGNIFSGKMRSRTFHWLLAIVLVCVGGISECSSSPQPEEGGYFLFTPPFGGDKPPKEVVASRRSGGDSNDIAPSARSISPSPAETLWVGSHRINWSPLPIFERFLNPESYHQKKQNAQARNYDYQDSPPPTPPSTQTQEPIITYSSPIPTDPNDSFSKKGLFGFGGGRSHSRSQKKSLFHNPHHDFSNKFSTGGFFSGLGPFGPKNAPKIKPPKFSSPIAERRSSSIQPSEMGRDYVVPPTSQTPNTTPSPVYRPSSTRNTILVSPPQAIYALSTPGPSISPIIDRLRQMTEWSRSKQSLKPQQEISSSSLMKKEGHQEKVNSSLERKLHLKKRLREGTVGGSRPSKTKSQKNNIEAIILANDDDDTTEIITGTKLTVQESKDSPRKSRAKSVSISKRKRKSRGRKVSKELQQRRKSQKHQKEQQQPSSQEQQEIRPRSQDYQLERPRNSDLRILHPTNAALLQEPLEYQQQSRRSYDLKRKDKQIDLFQNRGDSDVAAAFNHEGPISFRFGPEDAKVSPYFNN